VKEMAMVAHICRLLDAKPLTAIELAARLRTSTWRIVRLLRRNLGILFVQVPGEDCILRWDVILGSNS